MTGRRLLRAHPARRDDIGDLVTRRPLPGPDLPQVDPFLFLNHHGPQVYPPANHGLPFGPHPHRGFETVTFILEGELAHLDSGGHESVIRAGGIQWMTAGSGLVHAEVSPAAFKRAGGPLEILQLWVNLPRRLKMTRPAYSGVQRDAIPHAAVAPGVTLELASGMLGEQAGAVSPLTDVTLGIVRMAAGAQADLPAPAAHNVLLYAVRGSVAVGGTTLPAWHLAELDRAADTLALATRGEDAVLLFGHAPPIGEPVVSHGPFVMNTREEIAAAIEDYQRGLFGPAPAV